MLSQIQAARNERSLLREFQEADSWNKALKINNILWTYACYTRHKKDRKKVVKKGLHLLKLER